MTKVLALKEKTERSWILQEIWRWRYKFFICFFGTFFGMYIFSMTGNPYAYVAILNYFGYYVPAFIVYTVLHFTISYLITTIYAHRVEGLRYGRNS